MSLKIMQNLYLASWLHLTGHCYVRSMFVKHDFVAVVVCLFVVTVVIVAVYYYYYYYYCYYYYYYYLLLSFIYFTIIIIFNWYKLDCKFFAELWKFVQFQIKC